MNKAVFLDRDGTINVDKRYVYRKEDFVYLPDAVEGLRYLQSLGYCLIIVTNQSGIARGYYSEEDYLELDRWLKEDLLKRGVSVTASYYCPHHINGIVPRFSVDCECRKPRLEMYYRAAKEWDIDIDRSVAIGDKMRDLSICQNTKCHGILLEDNTDMVEDVPDSGIIRVRGWQDIIQCFSDGRCG